MSSATKPSVLVIDDDEIVLAAMEDLLERSDFGVTTRTTPIGVTRVIIEFGIDVVVLDVNMPIMRGDSVARLLRSWDRLRDVPVVIMSGLDEESLQAIRESLPSAEVLPKASMRSSLVPTVRRVYTVARAGGPAQKELVRGDASQIASAFLSRLGECMRAYRTNWLAYTSSTSHRLPQCQISVKALIPPAYLIGVREIGELLSFLYDSTEEFTRTKPPTAAVSHAVLRAVGALQDAANHPEGKLQVSGQVLVGALAKARAA